MDVWLLAIRPLCSLLFLLLVMFACSAWVNLVWALSTHPLHPCKPCSPTHTAYVQFLYTLYWISLAFIILLPLILAYCYNCRFFRTLHWLPFMFLRQSNRHLCTVLTKSCRRLILSPEVHTVQLPGLDHRWFVYCGWFELVFIVPRKILPRDQENKCQWILGYFSYFVVTKYVVCTPRIASSSRRV